MPVILAPADAARYSQIFDLQEIDGTATADKLISRLRDRSLVGHVLAERYLNAYGGPPSYDRLAAWLTKYRDLPQAERIYKLARKIRPKKRKRPSPPAAKHGSVGAEKVAPPPHWSKKNLTRKQRRRVSQLKRRARIYLSRGWVSRAEKMLSDPEVRRLFDRFEHDEARAQVAAAWFYFGEDKRAYKLAIVALARSGDKLPIAYWTAGLAAWRLQLYAQSASHFEALAAAQDDTGWIVSGGANWGRACPSQIRSIPRGNEVADGGRSPSPQAYGLLARHELGLEPGLEFQRMPLSRAAIDRLLSTSHGRRAFALIQVNRHRLAEIELLGLKNWQKPGMAEALLAVAEHAELPALAVKLTRRLTQRGVTGWRDGVLEEGLFPIPPWRTTNPRAIDRALLYAFMRQESDFAAFAQSPVGARGVMQLMPSTAKDLSRRLRFDRRRQVDLFNPDISVELGGYYLRHLLKRPAVRGDLIRLIASYNGGPGNVRYWERRMKHGNDPLLFVEILPSLETRLFVRRVLTNLWIYRHRLGQPAPSMADVSKGRWPKYRALDGQAATPPLVRHRIPNRPG